MWINNMETDGEFWHFSTTTGVLSFAGSVLITLFFTIREKKIFAENFVRCLTFVEEDISKNLFSQVSVSHRRKWETIWNDEGNLKISSYCFPEHPRFKCLQTFARRLTFHAFSWLITRAREKRDYKFSLSECSVKLFC